MKCRIFCALMMMTCAVHSFAQYQVEVSAIGKKQTISMAKVDSLDFRMGNEGIAADFTYMTVLANAIKFQLVFTKDVVKYHYYRTTLSNYKKHNEAYWINYLKEKTTVSTVKNVNVRVKNGLNENTQYICLMLPIDKDGNYGRMAKHVFKTPKMTAQPIAEISNVKHSTTLLEWQTASKEKAKTYYMMVNNGNMPVYAGMDDVDIAFLINKSKDTQPLWSDFSSFRKNIDKTDTNFEIVTWARDENGNMSGVISRYVNKP